jgi:hypothetical protein
VLTVETTATGLAVQGAETQAAVKAHTTVVQRAADTVADLAQSLDEAHLFELLPKVADTSAAAAAAAGDAKTAADRTALALAVIVEDEPKRAELLGKVAAGIDTINRAATAASAHAKAAVERGDSLAEAIATVGENVETLAGEQGTTQKAITAERGARERWQAATDKRLGDLATNLAAAKGAAELAQAAAERTAAAAEAQAANVEAILIKVNSCFDALVAIARGETKAAVAVLDTGDNPGAAGS